MSNFETRDLINDETPRSNTPHNPNLEAVATDGRWVILQLMGQRRIAGYAFAVRPYGFPQIGIIVPETTTQDEYYREYSPQAIYMTQPVSEAVARQAAEIIGAPKVDPDLH